MYADQFATARGLKPGSMTLALAMTALPIAGLIVSTHAARFIPLIDPVIEVRNIPLPKDPPPDPKPHPKTNPIAEKVYTPPIDFPPISDNRVITTPTLPEFPPMPVQPGTGIDRTQLPPPIAKPVIVGASYDSRFNNMLQPPYPASEIRSGNAGRVVIKVLIGADGRVKQVERVSAASDAFFAAAEKQALTKWRFKPATSNGVAIEQWKTMSLRFELQAE